MLHLKSFQYSSLEGGLTLIFFSSTARTKSTSAQNRSRPVSVHLCAVLNTWAAFLLPISATMNTILVYTQLQQHNRYNSIDPNARNLKWNFYDGIVSTRTWTRTYMKHCIDMLCYSCTNNTNKSSAVSWLIGKYELS